jgi:hypothetical protein
MIRSFRSLFAMVAAATAFLFATAPDAHAQTALRERWDVVTLGNNQVGVDQIAWACTRNNNGAERRVDELLQTRLRLFSANIELTRIAATAVRNGASFAGSTSFRRAGLTVRSRSFTTSGTESFTSTAAVFGSNQTTTVWIYFVPITIGANLGHTGAMSLSLLNMSNYGAMLSGFMETYAWGWASAAVGVAGAQVGLAVDIRLGEQRFDGVLGAFTGYLSTAYLTYQSTPLRLLLRAFLELGPLSGSLTLVDAALGARTFAPYLP